MSCWFLLNACVLCDRTIPVAERLFTSSVSVTLRQAVWYPSEAEEPHLVLLSSDNTVRCVRCYPGLYGITLASMEWMD